MCPTPAPAGIKPFKNRKGLMEVIVMEPGNVEVVAKICLVCGLELSVKEVKAGWVVCEGCQGYRVCLIVRREVV